MEKVRFKKEESVEFALYSFDARQSGRHMKPHNTMCSIEVKSLRNLKSKAEYARVASGHLYRGSMDDTQTPALGC